MNMSGGYAGSVLYVDLSEEKTRVESLNKEFVDKFLGGWGINVRLYYDLQKPKSDPFSPQSPIIIGAGPFVGTMVPGATKIVATYKTPILDENGRHFIDCAVAGTNPFGLMLKKAGYDHLVITGKSEKPIYLYVTEEGVEFCDASTLWADKDIFQTTDWLREKHGNCGVIAIGRAGEKLVRFAMAFVDYARHLGRFGLGAIMGSKNLKAIVTQGSKEIKIARADEFNEVVRAWRDDIRKTNWGFVDYSKYGVSAGMAFQGPLAVEGTMPWSTVQERFGYERYKEAVEKNLSCSFCPCACHTKYRIKDGKFAGLETYGFAWFEPYRVGQRLELEDWREAVKFVDFCNRVGMCVFTTSQIVNWITRLFIEGKLSEDIVGFKLERNFECYEKLIRMIVEREGFGDVLADGWIPTARKIEQDPHDHIWGTGIIQGVDVIQDARVTTLHPQAFTHLSGTRPHHGGKQSLYTRPRKHPDFLKADARRMGLTEEELERVFTYTPSYGPFNVGRYAKHVEDWYAVTNSVGVCIIHALWGDLAETLDLRIKYANIEMYAKIYPLVTGIETTAGELKIKGERAFNLYRILQIREGFNERPKPPREWFIPRKTPDGTELAMTDYYRRKKITEEDIREFLDDYFHERGWDHNGIPSKKKLKELGLDEFLVL